MRKLLIPVSIIGLIILDQVTKFWIVKNLELGEMKSFLSPIFSLTYVRNYGAAFSMLQNQQWFFTLVTITVIGTAIFYLIKHIKGSWLLVIGLSLVISGGLGNFIDRLRLGYVVDMVHLDFVDFAIFNVADSYLTVGVAILALALWKDEEAWK